MRIVFLSALLLGTLAVAAVLEPAGGLSWPPQHCEAKQP